MKKILKYVTKHKVIAGIIIVVVIALGYYTYTKIKGTTVNTQYVFGKVIKGDLVTSVSGTGQVATLSKVEIKPQTTGQTQTLGQIIKVNVQNGQAVKAGDVIAVLDGLNALQTLNQAKASVASAKANYNKLVGSSDSDATSGSPSIQSAKLSLQNSIQNLATKLQTDYISVSNAVLLNTDPFFANPLVNPILTIDGVYFNDQYLQNKVNNERVQIGGILESLKKDANGAMSTSDPVALANSAIAKFTEIRNYFDDMTTLFTSSAVSTSATGATNINLNKNTASNARSTANSAVSDIIGALQSYNSVSLSLSQTVKSLPDDLAVAQAQLDNANANLANAEKTYASRIITAPFDGQIGGLTAQVGQQISSSDVLGSIITPQKVVNISLNEVDAAKVAAGDSVVLTFDAFPSVKINGVVSFVDPLGTVSQGVVNYSVQITMNDQDDQIKTGMTATASIITNTKPDVLMVPSAAITKTGNRSSVLVPNTSLPTPTPTSTSTATSTKFRNNISPANSTVHAVPVVVGISNDTMTEIISGLNEGDTIVTRTITGTASTASTARTGSIFGIGGGSGTSVRTNTGR